MDDEVRLVKEVKGVERDVTVGYWEKSKGVIHPKEIFQKDGLNRLVLHDAVTSVKAAKQVMKELIAELRKKGWKDELSSVEQARVSAGDKARVRAYEDREAAERAAYQAKIDAFPKTPLEKKLAAAIEKGAAVKSLDLRGKKGDKISFIPPSINKLTKLRTLILDDNDIETFPEEFEQLKSLEYLSAARNKITEMRPACYVRSLRLLNLHGNQLDWSAVGQHQKNFEVHLGGNKKLRYIGRLRHTHTLGIDTDSLFPLDDDRYEKAWTSVKTVHLYGRDLTTAERKKAAKYFPKATFEFIGPASKGPRLLTEP